MRSSGGGNSRMEGLLEFGVVAAVVVVAFIATIGLGLWWLIDQAAKGSMAALVVITVLATMAIMCLAFFFFWGTLKVNQSQDERAMKMQLELLKTNAIENMTVMQETQKAMLLSQKTREAEAKADLMNGRLLASQQPQPQRGLTTVEGAFDGLD